MVALRCYLKEIIKQEYPDIFIVLEIQRGNLVTDRQQIFEEVMDDSFLFVCF